MELGEIDSILSSEATPLYKGTYAKDELKHLNFKNDFAIIVNTSTSDSKGPLLHWITIYKTRNKVIFFDSLAINDFKDPYFRNFFSRFNVKKITCIDTPIQQMHSSVCGMYCLLCVLYLRRNSFSKFLSIFSAKDLHSNDTLICILARKFFGIPEVKCDV